MSKSSQAVLKLASGGVLAQACPIILAPFLTRIYAPVEFAEYGKFVGFVALFGSIAPLRMEVPVVLSAGNRYQEYVVTAARLFACLLTIGGSIIAATYLFNYQSTNWLLIAVGLVCVLLHAEQIIRIAICNRERKYNSIASGAAIKSFSTVIMQLLIGVLDRGSIGLAVGHMIGLGAGVAVIQTRSKIPLAQWWKNKRKIYVALKRYRKFPMYSVWGVFASNLSYALPVFGIAWVFSNQQAGYYSIVQRLLGAPSALVGGAVGKVLYRDVVAHKSCYSKVRSILFVNARNLAIVASGFIVGVYLLIEQIGVAAILGEKWSGAADYVIVLLPFYVVRLFAAPFSQITNVYERQDIALGWQLSLLTITIFALFGGIGMRGCEQMLMHYSAVGCLLYAYLLLRIYRVVEDTKNG